MQKSQQYKIIISGGGSGIGARLAEELSSEGHSVIICGRRINRLRQLSEKNNNVCFFQCDVSEEKEVIEFVRFVSKDHDCVDVLINCAGLFGAIGRFDQTDSTLWKKTIDINLFGTYLLSKYFLPLLLKSETKKMINFAGGGAFGTFPNYSAYAASKSAVVRLSENMAQELRDFGILVNCIAPGFVATGIHDATLAAGESVSGREHFQLTQKKLKDGAVPMEIPVECVKFLISQDSDGLTGKTISASFDKWNSKEFKNSIQEISESDLFTMRRINLNNLDNNSCLRQKLSEQKKSKK